MAFDLNVGLLAQPSASNLDNAPLHIMPSSKRRQGCKSKTSLAAIDNFGLMINQHRRHYREHSDHIHHLHRLRRILLETPRSTTTFLQAKIAATRTCFHRFHEYERFFSVGGIVF
jgi:hypothetical protein